VQRLVALAACILIAAGGAALGRLALPSEGLRGHYYTNLTRSGDPIATAIDRELSTDTLDNGTAGVWPAYSVEWTGYLIVDRPGIYEFATISDDGSEIDVADRAVVRNGGLHGPQEARGTVDLGAGVHPVRVRYEQAGGGFALEVRYGRPGDALVAIAPSRLTPDPITYRAYRLRRVAPWVSAVLAVLVWLFAARGAPQRDIELRPRAIDRPAVAITIIVIVGLAMRLLFMLGADAILWGDSDVFIESFGSIRSGRLLEHDPHRTLLYPYFLTAFLIWSGEPPMDQIIVGAQHLLGVITAVAFYVAGRPAFGSRVALAGALLLTVHTTQLFYELSILSEAFFGCALALCLIPIGRFVARPSIRGAGVSGLACAVLTLTRPVAELFVIVPLVLMAVMVSSWRSRLVIGAALMATYLAIMVPWASVNQRQFGFFGVALGRGFGLFIRVFDIDRLEPRPDTRLPEVRAMLDHALKTTQYSPATYVRDELRRHRYSAAQADELMSQFAVETALHQPWRFAVNSAKQWALQIGGPLQDEAICASPQGAYVCSRRTQGYAREPFLNRPRYADEPARPWVVAYVRHFQIPMSLTAALAAFGAVAYLLSSRPEWVRGAFLAAVTAYFTFLPAFAQSPQDRYRLPVDALLFMFAVFGAVQLVGRTRHEAPVPRPEARGPRHEARGTRPEARGPRHEAPRSILIG